MLLGFPRTAAWLLLLARLSLTAAASCEDGQLGMANRTDAFCSWTGFAGIPYIPMSNVQLINDLLPKSCSDPWLSAEDQFFCKRCCSLSTRRACLGTVGRKWNDGADTQSCSWMSRDGKGLSVREVEYSIGVNFPYNIANVVNPATCREERLYTVLSPPEAYSTAYFSVLASVDDPDDKIARPLGLAPDASCVVRAPARSCTVNFWSSDDVHFVMSSRDMWTTNTTIISSLRSPGNADCLYRPGARCVPASTPFRYRLHLTVHPCPPGQRAPEVVRSLGQLPISEPGALLTPGGSPLNYRETGFYLQGAQRATWDIVAEKSPILVAVVPQDVVFAACHLQDARCDYRRVWPRADPATLCFSRRCTGSLGNRANPNSTDILLVVGGLEFPNEEQLVPQGTVQQTIWADVRGYPAPHVD